MVESKIRLISQANRAIGFRSLHGLVRCALKDLASVRGRPGIREGATRPQPQVEEMAGLEVCGACPCRPLRLVDPCINMARLGSMQRDGHWPPQATAHFPPPP